MDGYEETSEDFQRGYAAAIEFAMIASRNELRDEQRVCRANISALDAMARRA